ncbi:MAG: hypothetical protein KKC05_04170, partial [Nanoarchaeota archaeon]|nr:hypothetical protein [Nanoarchaeota archaeon]
KQREKLLEEQGFNLVSAPFHKTLREFAAEQYISLNTLTKLVPYINPDDKLNHRLIPVPVNIERAHEIVQHEIDTTHEVTPDTTETIEGFTTLFAVDITDSKVDTFQEDSTLLTEKTETIEDSTLLAADITESKAETVQEDSMLLAGNIYSGKNPEPSLFSSFLNLIQDNVLEGTKFDITLVPTIPSRIVEDIKGRWEWIINPGYRYRLIYLICLAACLIGILIWIRYRDYKVSIYFYTYSADTIPKKDMWKYRLHRCGVYLTIGPPCLAVLMKLII